MNTDDRKAATASVQEVFIELIDLPETERIAKLPERCGGDAQLESHVRKLLEADAENERDETFSGPAADIGAGPMPLRVGNYVVRAVVGEGGMGSVYDALHEPTGRRAAVKLIRVGIATLHQRERFRIEAETLGRLNDPGIAQLYDAGPAEVVWPEGAQGRRPFIAMEFVENAMSCVEFARKQKLPPRECVKLVEQVARAVQHAHQRGVIHRDLKPGNVLVTAQGQPKVVDFGIARLVDATAVDGVTVTGQILGTVRYMSPEQAGGDPRLVDTRADIYSLGAILYEMLAGRPLIEVPSGSNLGAVIKVLNAAPPQLAAVRPELAGDLDAIVHKAIAHDPNDRYASASAMADDLARYLDGREVSARAPRTIERFVRVVKRNKGKFAAVALIALSLVGGIIGTTWGLVRADRARRNEVKEREIAQANEAKATDAEADTNAYGEFLSTRVLAAARPKDVQAGLGTSVSVAEALEEAEKHLDEDFKDRPRAEALARHAIGVTWRNLGRLEAAEKQLRRAVELRERVLGPNDPSTLQSRNSLAVVVYDQRRFDEGIAIAEETLARRKAAFGADNDYTLASMTNLAAFYSKSGRGEQALAMLKDVLATQRRALGPNHLETLATLERMANVYLQLRKLDEALPAAQEAVDRLTATVGPDHPETLRAMFALSDVFAARKEPVKCVPLLEHVVEARRKSFGPGHPETAAAIGNLSLAYLDTGQFDKGIAMLPQVVGPMRKVMGAKSPGWAQTLVNLCNKLFEHDQFAAAEPYLREVIQIREQVMPGQPPLFEAQCMLGKSLAAQNKSDEAITVMTAGVEGLDRQATLSPHLESRRQSAGKAMVDLLEKSGQKDSAESWRKRLATIKPTTAPATSLTTSPTTRSG
jgi:serine/threonine protein kinase